MSTISDTLRKAADTWDTLPAELPRHEVRVSAWFYGPSIDIIFSFRDDWSDEKCTELATNVFHEFGSNDWQPCTPDGLSKNLTADIKLTMFRVGTVIDLHAVLAGLNSEAVA